MQKFITPLINVFKFHKKKIGVFTLSVLLFSLLLFHYNDLGDLVSAKVIEATNGSVSVQFEDMGISFFPFGVKLQNVYVNTPMVPELKTDSLAVSPTIWGAITGRPGIKIRLGGIFDGGIYASAQLERKEKSEILTVNADWNSLSLKSLLKLQNITLPIKGSIDGEAENVKVDLKFSQPPSGKVVLKSKVLEMPSTPIATIMGPIELPNLKFSEIAVSTSLKDRDLNIENAMIGTSKDDISANLTGRIGVQINAYPSGMNAQFNNYKLNLELRVKERVAKTGYLPLALGFLEKCKTGASAGTLVFRCVFEGAQFGTVPRISTF
ncbi:MAG: hypothetical protein A4S09_08340 [Proteobacteria bacterium SG_bin7]|nr:MAG: hypothetical protein A4S09_08340 [Proteobacteria bacterium SG_bin7]